MFFEKILELYYAKPGIRQLLGIITLFSLLIIQIELIANETAGLTHLCRDQINAISGNVKPTDLVGLFGALYYLLSSLLKILMIFGQDLDRDYYYYIFAIYFLYLLTIFITVFMLLQHADLFQVEPYQYSLLTKYLAPIMAFGYPLADIIDFVMDGKKRFFQQQKSYAKA